MILNTHPDDRKEMVRAISECIALLVRYMGIPACAYQIGGIIVDREGTISGDDEAELSAITPVLIESGWLEQSPESAVGCVDITLSVQDWTVAQLINLLRTICSKQYLLNRMMQRDTLFIEEAFVTAISDNQPADTADFEARVRRAADAGCIRGNTFESGRLIVSTPCCAEESERLQIFNEMFTGILKSAMTAARISVRQQNDPEKEKYHANSWLLRLGFGGARYKELAACCCAISMATLHSDAKLTCWRTGESTLSAAAQDGRRLSNERLV